MLNRNKGKQKIAKRKILTNNVVTKRFTIQNMKAYQNKFNIAVE